MLEPVHWWRFAEFVRSQSGPGYHHTPPHPDVGFLLKHRYRALTWMRRELRHSTAAADVSFCVALDQPRYNRLKSLAVVYAAGTPHWLAKIEAADTLTEIQRVFNDLVGDATAVSTSQEL
jgi:hypothetical protein